jgi:predicted Zn-dependent protease
VPSPAPAAAIPSPPAPASGALPADIAQQLERGAVTEAERASARLPAGSSERLAATRAVKAARQSLGLPGAGGRFRLAPEAEPAYVAAVRQARQAVQSDPAGAGAVLAAGLARFPGAPGLLVLACDLGVRQGQAEQAARRCGEAVAKMPDLVAAHRLLGAIKLEAGQYDAALVSLRRALELGGADAALWESLGQAYRALGRQREFSKLLADHEDAEAAAAAAPSRSAP